MSKIRVLHDQTINKIAAGEVIENPSSVVKELVENALDAGADEISVEIRCGGRQLIRVTDNGSGMSSDDALLCLERHATSKIKEVEDIQDLITMGFRGEAIPSIASISKFTLLTSTQEAKNSAGTLVMVDGGQIVSCGPAARSPGTTIEIKSLFFNVPVRKKFQKSPAYDAQEILKMMNMISLGNPGIKFELISDEKHLLKTEQPSDKNGFQEKFADRMKTILGLEFFKAVQPLSFSHGPWQMEGFIGQPSYTKPNRTGQYLFINQRPVHSSFIAFAIREGYGTALPTNRYPVFALHLSMSGALVDVNVHPQKKEVRLRQESLLKEHLMQAVQQSLQGAMVTDYTESLTTDEQITNSIPMCAEPATYCYQPKADDATSSRVRSYHDFKADYKPILPPKIRSETEAPLDLLPPVPIKKITPRIISTLPGFIQVDPLSCGMTDGLCLIDQKEASFRIQYERLLKKDEKSSAVQPLLVPMTVDFSTYEANLLKEQMSYLNQLGFSIQELSHDTFLVDAIPDLFKKEDLKSCLIGICQDLSECGDDGHLEREKLKRLARSASRLAESGIKKLHFDEAQSLINQLFLCENPLHCPLGKAIFIHLNHEKLKQIKGT